jgi:bifunctional non-homologous end joining protein LigD
VKPLLLAEVEYRAKSAHGKLRHPAFKGLRDDL